MAVIARLEIKEMPGVGMTMEASGNYEVGEGGLAEELMMEAVKVVSAALDARDDMSSPQIVAGEKESIRKVYGDEIAEKHAGKHAPKKKLEPGTILKFPS